MVDSTADSPPVIESAPVAVNVTLTPVEAPAPEPCPAPVATAAEVLKKGIENNGHSYLHEMLAALKAEFDAAELDLRGFVKDLF